MCSGSHLRKARCGRQLNPPAEVAAANPFQHLHLSSTPFSMPAYHCTFRLLNGCVVLWNRDHVSICFRYIGVGIVHSACRSSIVGSDNAVADGPCCQPLLEMLYAFFFSMLSVIDSDSTNKASLFVSKWNTHAYTNTNRQYLKSHP